MRGLAVVVSIQKNCGFGCKFRGKFEESSGICDYAKKSPNRLPENEEIKQPNRRFFSIVKKLAQKRGKYPVFWLLEQPFDEKFCIDTLRGIFAAMVCKKAFHPGENGVK